MARTVKLLPGSRMVGNDIGAGPDGGVSVNVSEGETEKVAIDCTRWLDTATISIAADNADFIALSTASPIVTATLTGSSSNQYGKITITASDGRVRVLPVTVRSFGSETFEDYV